MKNASTAALDLLKERSIDYMTASSTDPKYYIDGYSIYRYFTKYQLESELDIKDSKQEVIINFQTREVISVQGKTYNDITYHTLEQMK